MSMTPTEVMEDLETYISLYNLKISTEARKTLGDIEEFGFKCNYPCNYILFFSKPIRNMKELQRLFFSKGINPNLAALILEIKFYDLIDVQTNYQKGNKLYSYIHDRSSHDKTAILDKAMRYCVKEERTVLENKDIVLAAIDYFENQIVPNRLVNFNCDLSMDTLTLSHVYGGYDESLSISFDEIRYALQSNNEIKAAINLV
jgi:hypothetical protein